VTFLVDSDVLSEPTKPRPDERVIAWLLQYDRELGTNPIIAGEIHYGILRLAKGRRRDALHNWFITGVQRLRMYEIDAETGDEWARLMAELRKSGRAMPVRDSLIAATARQHDLAVATRNVADYRYAGIKVVNPFAT
jgi:predicted nucleic acid-binding protein